MTGKSKTIAVSLCLLAALGCRDERPGPRTLAADVPLHLEDHLDAARIAESNPAAEIIYGDSWAGTGVIPWGRFRRRVLYTHVPGKLEYRVKIPDKGRLDVGLGVFDLNIPVKFRISARLKDDGPETLLEASSSAGAPRLQRSVDLSGLAGKSVTLSLETEAEKPGNVAFWAAPTLAGERKTEKPNIIFYVIDGAAPDFMSVYGYGRRTTRYLERLASEGAVFENAYSNSSFTKVSTPSFMTSLHCSVLGGHRGESDPLPGQAVTLAERLHKAGYMTEVLTSNPYCGRMSGLDRGVDILMDTGWRGARPSSADLHGEFWRLRDAYPAEPYWVHFQPTDVHQPWDVRGASAGLFARPDDGWAFGEMLDEAMGEPGLSIEESIEQSGVDRVRFFQIARNLYDEGMAHQDRTIGRFVERLKRRGEWERTLFIVASDHGHVAAGLPLLDPKPPPWEAPILASHKSRIPLIFVWPGKIKPGLRLSQPVSMIDILPTVLDLAGLPRAEIAQGRSLAPLLLGKRGWRPRPVVLDEFYVDRGYLWGSIEVIDGRWGASLRIDPRPADKVPPRNRLRPAPLLLFDLENDPHAFRSLHEERPELVRIYSKILGRLWNEHLSLAAKFTRAGELPLTPEQIETLRSLGYLR
jgi:arylsulfatase A-like enzyme